MTLFEIVEKWKGTPYWHNGQDRHGIDCGNFIGRIFEDLGVIEGFEGRHVSRDWFLHGQRQILLNSILENEKKLGPDQKIAIYPKTEPPRDKDILLFSIARNGVANHAGIYLGDGSILHCTEHKGVRVSPLGDWLRKRLIYVLRLEETNGN